jgi:hypothetical protein
MKNNIFFKILVLMVSSYGLICPMLRLPPTAANAATAQASKFTRHLPTYQTAPTTTVAAPRLTLSNEQIQELAQDIAQDLEQSQPKPWTSFTPPAHGMLKTTPPMLMRLNNQRAISQREIDDEYKRIDLERAIEELMMPYEKQMEKQAADEKKPRGLYPLTKEDYRASNDAWKARADLRKTRTEINKMHEILANARPKEQSSNLFKNTLRFTALAICAAAIKAIGKIKDFINIKNEKAKVEILSDAIINNPDLPAAQIGTILNAIGEELGKIEELVRQQEEVIKRQAEFINRQALLAAREGTSFLASDSGYFGQNNNRFWIK